MKRIRKYAARGRTATVGSVVHQLLGKIEANLVDPGHQVFDVWEEVVGARINQHARPVALDGRILKVEVDSSVWLYELSTFKADQIKAALNDRLGSGEIEKIVFRPTVKKQKCSTGRELNRPQR